MEDLGSFPSMHRLKTSRPKPALTGALAALAGAPVVVVEGLLLEPFGALGKVVGGPALGTASFGAGVGDNFAAARGGAPADSAGMRRIFNKAMALSHLAGTSAFVKISARMSSVLQ